MRYGNELIQRLIELCGSSQFAFEYQNENYKRSVSQVVQWLAGGINKKPWLLLQGDTGTGKTTIALAVAQFINNHKTDSSVFGGVAFQSAKALARACVSGEELSNGATFEECSQRFKYLVIDDVGTENAEILSYGNAERPIAQILEERYNRRQCTIISTNLNDEDMMKRYGKRVISRMAELVYRVEFKNEDFRIKNRNL